MEDALLWVESHPGLASWIQGLGTMLAGLAALVAGAFAYKAAVQQAAVIRDAPLEAEKLQRRALAGGLFAELQDCKWRLLSTLHALQKREITTFPLHSLDVTIYQAGLPEMGKLPPVDAFVTVSTFKVISAYRGEVEARKIRPDTLICPDEIKYWQKRAAQVMTIIEGVEAKIADIAEMSVSDRDAVVRSFQERAQAVREAGLG